MRAILIHGMGRTPVAMLVLATRLRAAGIRSSLFGYVAAFERFGACAKRLEKFIEKQAADEEFIVVGHSLGTVLARAALPNLIRKPRAFFMLAPPTQACLAARKFASFKVFRLFTGEMGQLLASKKFMDALPLPDVPTKIYSGSGGPRGRGSPFGDAPNDGVLLVSETTLPGVPMQTLPVIHTFMMNQRVVAQDIVRIAKSIAISDAGNA
jgi:pimeloyl-ACP methyl ester carboxylesterase